MSPAKDLAGDDKLLTELEVTNGSTITVNVNTYAPAPVVEQKPVISNSQPTSFPEQAKKSEKPKKNSPDLVGNEGVVVRRVVDADNSCLFNSIG
jgi:hypothetical protein